MNVLLNLPWLELSGLWMVLGYMLVCIVRCLTIIDLPSASRHSASGSGNALGVDVTTRRRHDDPAPGQLQDDSG